MSSTALIGAVRAGAMSEVIALVDGMTDAERRACVPELKRLRGQLRAESWQFPAQRAYPALHAAGAACQTGAAAVAAWLTGSELRLRQAPPAVLIDVLGDRDPAWLADLVRRLAECPAAAEVPYELMAGLVRLAGCPVPTSEAYVRGWMDHIGWARRNGGTVVGNLRKDPHLGELVAALFETEEIGARGEWRYGEGLNDWTYALTQLTRVGLLDRKVMVDGCVARLLRGGASTADNRTFLGLLTALDLTRDEQRERIADWTALCSDGPSTVAAHAQALLAGLALDGELGPRALAEMSDAVLFRTEKKLVRAQLVLLGKVLRQDPSTVAELLPAVARAFGHADTEVQERALKLVERHLPDLGSGDLLHDELVRHAYRDRDALVAALEPVAARRWWAGREQTAVDRHFREFPDGLEVVVATLFERVGTSTPLPSRDGASEAAGCVHSALAGAFEARLWEVAYRIRAEPLPFLLATPTWSTGALEPEELVTRLDAYRRLGARPGEVDFAQALVRLRRDDSAALASAAVAARELGTREGDRLAEWLLTDVPSQPLQRSRTAGPRILVEFGELPELRSAFFPPAFRRLGRPLSMYRGSWRCPHWRHEEWRHWLAVVPGRPELMAGRVLRDLSLGAIEDTRTGFSFLPTLAEAEGETGEAVRLCVAYGLGARRPEDRLAAVDALLVLAARGRLDAKRLGADLGSLAAVGSVRPSRLAEAIGTAAATGAYGTAWSVLREVLPPLLAALTGEGAARTPTRGLGDLLAVAAECAERCGAHGELPHLAAVADRRGSSRLLTQARRLRAALEETSAA
ncbi:DUF7824 domain-containing protein [Streptomyces bottropensis]|uniref:DUF7824 domain-containing protein n=1 Tax=Streptomyces bottropensis TaxID=42235 RepID=UPI0036C2429F